MEEIPIQDLVDDEEEIPWWDTDAWGKRLDDMREQYENQVGIAWPIRVL